MVPAGTGEALPRDRVRVRRSAADRVTILAQIAEQADEIDVARAEAAKRRAEERLAQADADMDFERARIALLKSLIRLQVASSR